MPHQAVYQHHAASEFTATAPPLVRSQSENTYHASPSIRPSGSLAKFRVPPLEVREVDASVQTTEVACTLHDRVQSSR
jgi:hypothetical protein